MQLSKISTVRVKPRVVRLKKSNRIQTTSEIDNMGSQNALVCLLFPPTRYFLSVFSFFFIHRLIIFVIVISHL
jgi:hypothetical protein